MGIGDAIEPTAAAIKELQERLKNAEEEINKTRDKLVEAQVDNTRLSGEIEELSSKGGGVPASILTKLATAMDKMSVQHKVSCPIFKGESKEDPAHHLLKAVDWFIDVQLDESEYCKEFCKTLDKHAREWYDEITIPDTWEELSKKFAEHYSTQGRSIKHLHERWRTLSFDPTADDISKFISNVRQTAKQLGHNDLAVINLIKACMPPDIYGTLYPVNDLNVLIAMVKDIYAPKAGNTQTSATTALAPFAKLNGNTEKTVSFKDAEITNQTLTQLNTVLNQLKESTSQKPPYKPYIAQKGKGHKGKGNNGQKGTWRGRNRSPYPKPRPNNDRFRSNSRPRTSGRPVDRDQDRCYNCRNHGHWSRNCPERSDRQNYSDRRSERPYRHRSPDRRSDDRQRYRSRSDDRHRDRSRSPRQRVRWNSSGRSESGNRMIVPTRMEVAVGLDSDGTHKVYHLNN